jgi:tRNA(Ile)-lysidine synthase
VARSIRRRRLLTRGEVVVVGVSGGADSVFLVLTLAELAPALALRLHVAHLDHGWRGAESAADAAFVRDLAARLGLPFHAERLAAAGRRAGASGSPEDRARRARYAFFRDVCRQTGARVVATGHTQDDQVETVLLGLVRGSGLLGLSGMAWRAPLPVPDAEGLIVVRPLLGVPREAIRVALRARGESWREDATNADLSLPRNRLRAQVIPLLESISPGFRPALLRSAALARQAGEYVAQEAARRAVDLFRHDAGALRASRTAFVALPPALQGEVLRWAAAQLQGSTVDLEWAHVQGAVEMITRGRGGAASWLSPWLRVRLERGEIVVAAGEPGAPRASGNSARRQAP